MTINKQPPIILTDSAIVDVFKRSLSKNYFDEVNALIAKNDMTLYVKHYDLPDEFLDYIWKQNQAEKYLKFLNEAVKQLFKEIHNPELYENRDIDYERVNAKLLVDDPKLVSKLGKINTDLMNKIVSFECIIISKSNIMTGVENKVFKCQDCETVYPVKVRSCAGCESKNIQFSLNNSTLTNIEYLTVQERQSDMLTSSTTPRQMEVLVKGDLVNKYKAGETVRITGFVKPRLDSSEEKLNKNKFNEFIDVTSFEIMVEVHNIESIITTHDAILSNPKSYIKSEDESAILSLRKKYPNDMELLKVLTNSFAPHVYGHNEIKQAVLFQAVSSTIIEGQRNNINILLVGDPGLAKSKLLKAAAKINIHSALAVGKGSSGVGLTASVITDKKGLPRLHIGVAVLADKGICCIDELSNISDEHKAHLLECMEDGQFTVNKQGINQTLNARAAFFIASNPDEGRYSTYNSLTDNISLSPQLISRFDFIFVVIDRVDKKNDKKLMDHISTLYNPSTSNKYLETVLPGSSSINIISEDLLKKYLVYAKINNTEDVRISKEAYSLFENFYHDLRQPLKSSDITATPRQFEGMLRISIACARLLLKREVTEEIAQYVIRLLNYAYESTGMKLGNSTGLNQTMIYSERLKDMKNKKKCFMMVMDNLTKNNTIAADRYEVVTELMHEAEWPQSEAFEFFDKMVAENRLDRMDKGKYLINRDIS